MKQALGIDGQKERENLVIREAVKARQVDSSITLKEGKCDSATRGYSGLIDLLPLLQPLCAALLLY